jgi:sialate O-acetylesterase
MAVTIDIGDSHNIHPRNKQELGRRLALIAEGQPLRVAPETSGPVFARATREGKRPSRALHPRRRELVARGGPVKALELAGADRQGLPPRDGVH